MEQLVNITSRRPVRAVTLTDGAVAKVRELLVTEGDPGLALRMAVRPGGCSGFSYEMFFDSDRSEADVIEEFDGLDVVVDRQSVDLLRGSTLDYQDGPHGGGFRHQQPERQQVVRLWQ